MTTLFLRDSVEDCTKFSVNLDGVALNRRQVETSIACVQSFVRSPRCTQRHLSSDNGIGQLVSAISAAGTIREEPIFEPWANVLPQGYEATVVDLKKAYDAVVVMRKDAWDTSERCFGRRSKESSEVREPSCRTGVRILDVVDVRQVEYLSESIRGPDQPCSSSATVPPRTPGKGKRKRSATPSPAATPKRLFEFDVESIVLPKGRGVYLDDANFEWASKGREKTAASRRSGRSRRAAPVFQ